MEDWVRDLRLGWLRLWREPAVAILAILMLALGLGANTAIFSVVRGVLLRPLSYAQPDQLVSVQCSIPQFADRYPILPVNLGLFHAWDQRSRALSAMAMMRPLAQDLTGTGDTQRVVVLAASTGLLGLLGEHPALGRDFDPAEGAPGKNHVVILTDGFWRSRLHADPAVLGQTIGLNGVPNQIIGVLPPGFRFPSGEQMSPLAANGVDDPVQLLQPLAPDYSKALLDGDFDYAVFARLRPGVGISQLRAELNGISAGTLSAAHIPMQVNTLVVPLRDQIVGGSRAGLWLLLAAVGAIQLIICLNLANLLLVRVQARGHESAIRMALGASRGRLLRETATEGILLGLSGGVLGLAVALGATRWLLHVAPAGLPRLDEARVDGVVLLFALLLALASGILCSLLPAWRASRTDPQAALRAGGRGLSGGANRQGRWMIAAQCAATAMLLSLGGLLAASYIRLMRVNKGFQPDHVLALQAEWMAGSVSQRTSFFGAVLPQLAALPGVRASGLIDTLPTQGTGDTQLLSLVGDTRPTASLPVAFFRFVSPGYFSALGVPILRGRTFTQAEADALPPRTGSVVPAVITPMVAAKMWPGMDPMGRIFTRRGARLTFMVIGEAADTRLVSLAAPPDLTVYVPYAFQLPRAFGLVLRTQADPIGLAASARAAISRLEPAVALTKVAAMDQVVADSVSSQRFQLNLVLLFALTALLLAALGVYGVVAYWVVRREKEIGIRLALGADRSALLRLVLRQGLTPVAAGSLLGLLAALGGGRILGSLLFQVRVSNPFVLLGAGALLLLAGACACLLPARRALHVDPLAAMRVEP